MTTKLSVTLLIALSLHIYHAHCLTSSKITDPSNCVMYPCLIFEDEFTDFDFDIWQHEITAGGGGNWEFEYYTNNRSNSYVKNGNLYIKPTLTADKYGDAFLTSGTLDLWGSTQASLCTSNAFYGCTRTGSPTNVLNPVQSARIRSVQSFDVRYGEIEVRAKMPTGDWIWPAIWMLPTKEAYGGWPASGEIDLVEGRGNQFLTDASGVNRGVNQTGSTLHWGPYYPYNAYQKTTGSRNGTFGADFHKFGAVWDPNSIRLLIDDVTVVNATPGAGGFWEFGNFGLPAASNPWQYSKNQRLAPFDQPFFFTLNVAVGGTGGYFPDSWINSPYPKPWNNTSGTAARDFWKAKDSWYPTWNPTVNNGEDAALQVDYIKVWKLQADSSV